MRSVFFVLGGHGGTPDGCRQYTREAEQVRFWVTAFGGGGSRNTQGVIATGRRGE